MSDFDAGATSEVEEGQSIDDTLSEALNSIRARDGIEATPDEPVIENTEEAVKAGYKADSVENKEGTPDVPDPLIPKPEADAVQAAPNTWKKEAAALWDKTDPVVRAEIQRREADFHKGIEQYRQSATFAHAVDTAITPYKQTLQQLGITPEVAIRELMGADHKLRYGSDNEKHEYFMQLAHTYGINLNTVANAQQNIDPEVYKVYLDNQRLQAQIDNHQFQVQQQANQSLNSEIARFEADPKHIHYASVRGHMAALLQAGQATTLDDAYEQAIYANPVTRQAVLQQQAQVAREESARKANAARTASSVNVRTRPALVAEEKIGTMDDTLWSTLSRLKG